MIDDFGPTASVSILAESLYRKCDRVSRKRRKAGKQEGSCVGAKGSERKSTGEERPRVQQAQGVVESARVTIPCTETPAVGVGGEQQPTILLLDDCLKLTSRRNRDMTRSKKGSCSSRINGGCCAGNSARVGISPPRRRPHLCCESAHECDRATIERIESRDGDARHDRYEQDKDHIDHSIDTSSGSSSSSSSSSSSISSGGDRGDSCNSNISSSISGDDGGINSHVRKAERPLRGSDGRKLTQHYLRAERETDADSVTRAKAAMHQFQAEVKEWEKQGGRLQPRERRQNFADQMTEKYMCRIMDALPAPVSFEVRSLRRVMAKRIEALERIGADMIGISRGALSPLEHSPTPKTNCFVFNDPFEEGELLVIY